jgi:hypothetical protein
MPSNPQRRHPDTPQPDPTGICPTCKSSLRAAVKLGGERCPKPPPIWLVMQLPDGTTREYRLRATRFGLRLVGRGASYDLLTMWRDGGWRIQDLRTECGVPASTRPRDAGCARARSHLYK